MNEKNPWLAIWTEPRATIRSIVAQNPNRSLWLLACIYGFSSLLNSFQSFGLGNQLGVGAIFVIALLLSPLWGYAVFSVWSWLVCWTGKLLKGQGSFRNTRAAYAWSCVPITLNGIIWIFMIFFFGQPLFSDQSQDYFLTNGQATFLFIVLIVKVILAVWSLVIYLNALAEVQNYSVLKAIGNVILAAIIMGVVLAILWSVSLSVLGVSLEPANTSLHLFYNENILGYLPKG